MQRNERSPYLVIEEHLRLISDSLVPDEPHGVVDDERGEQIAVDVDARAFQALPV